MKIISKEIKNVIPEAYLPFSAYVIQTRALPDSRDCLKTNGRYIIWSQYFDKNTYDKRRKKGSDIVGRIMHWNPHGDSGIWGSVVRFAKPFSMRYPLEDSKGNVGTMTAGDDFAQPRYLELRSSELAAEFTKLIKKDTIDEWKMNFTGEDKYPAVFPTLFPNFVNGNVGIGVGCISNIPSFNLREAINSLKILVKNPEATYDDIYIPPDFPTGATIINSKEVKESLRTGRGKAVKLRAVLEYNEKDNAIEVKELPFQVFTNRIMGEIEAAIEEGNLTGIKNYYDGTDKSCGKYGTKIIIYLNNGTNVQRICRQLYKETSLQSSFTVCQLMLENGNKPKQYGLKEIMLSYLNHAMSCLKKSYIYDYNKIKKAIAINEGYLIAIENIDAFVEYIKNANDEKEIASIFKDKYGLSEEQSNAIIELKLRKLMKLEAIKINKELEKQKAEIKVLDILINDKEEFKKSFIGELDRIANKWGDERRTKVINLEFTSDDEDAEPIEQKELLINYTNMGNFYTMESSTLITQRRGAKGKKLKMKSDEVSIFSLIDSNYSNILVFTNKGKMYQIPASEIPIGRVHYSQLLDLADDEIITTIISTEKKNAYKYLLFITKNGMIKKSESKLYNSCSKRGLAAIKLKEGDEVLNVCLINDEKIGILTKKNNFLITDSDSIEAIGRQSTGVKGIKLQSNDYVIDAKAIPNSSTNLVAATHNGLIKKTLLSEYHTQGRATMGNKISKVKDNDYVIKFLTTDKDCDIIIIGNEGTVRINTKEISLVSKNALGVKGTNQEITNLLKAKS